MHSIQCTTAYNAQLHALVKTHHRHLQKLCECGAFALLEVEHAADVAAVGL
jgi:hypothetical protein